MSDSLTESGREDAVLVSQNHFGDAHIEPTRSFRMSTGRRSRTKLSQGVRPNDSAAATTPATGALLKAVVDISHHNGEIDLARANRDGALTPSVDNPLGTTVGTLQFRDAADHDLREKEVSIAGYARFKDDPAWGVGTLWTHSRLVTGADRSWLYYDIDTSEGQSGSPVAFDVDGLAVVMGIHNTRNTAGNQGLRLGPQILAAIHGWAAL